MEQGQQFCSKEVQPGSGTQPHESHPHSFEITPIYAAVIPACGSLFMIHDNFIVFAVLRLYRMGTVKLGLCFCLQIM